MTERLDRTERLLNLLFAFMAAGQPMTRAQVRSVVAGYQDSPSDEAFERMFERDKDELRGMGVPVTTVLNASGEVEGYHIPKDVYALAPIEFTPAELSALAVAAQAWDEAVFAPAASLALRKLESYAPQARHAELTLTTAHLESSEPWLSSVIEGLREDTALSFAYRKAGELEAQQRRITPISLVSRHGHWYLVGLDHDRNAVRVFRVSRMASAPKAAGPRRDVPSDLDVLALIDVPSDDDSPGVARVRVKPHHAVSLRRMGTVVDDVVTIAYDDRAAMVRAIVASGRDALVLDPPELVQDVQDALELLLAAHGGRT